MSAFGVRSYLLVSLLELMDRIDPNFLDLLVRLCSRGNIFRILDAMSGTFLETGAHGNDATTQALRSLGVGFRKVLKLPPSEGIDDIPKDDLLPLADRFEENGFPTCAILLRDEAENPNYSVTACLPELEKGIYRELRSLVLMRIPAEKAKYYERPQQFGAETEQKFPATAGDIEEAGKCLAVGRYTASVFHLMRVMEIVVQEFGNRLCIALTAEKNWQNILDEINKGIKALPAGSPSEKKIASDLAGAAAHFFNVKLAWRNQVMHPKDTYTGEEAEEVYLHVKAFIRHLAGIL